MYRINTLNTILQEKIVAIIRLENSETVMPVVEALAEGNIKVLEVTVGTPGVFSIIESLVVNYPELCVGVGTVLDDTTARMAIEAGARFLVTPVAKTSIIHTAHRYDVPVCMGAFSPTEILQCFEEGADIVKVFPADVAGMAFIKAVKAPMPQLRLMPTGGVSVENAADWIAAGACALGVGSALVSNQRVQNRNFSEITTQAVKLRENLGLD